MAWIIQWLVASYKSTSPVIIYTYTSTSNNTWLNWNWANDNYAWSFTATNAWIPTKLVLRINSIVWTPIWDFYIKSDKTIGSTTYASATWITLTSWTNTITLTWWITLTSWTKYWIYFSRTSTTSNYFRIYNEISSPPAWAELWRSSSSNIDPNTKYSDLWISMDIEWVI